MGISDAKILVRAPEGKLVPWPGRAGSWIGTAPEEVNNTIVVRRQIADGSLIDATPRTTVRGTGTRSSKGKKDKQPPKSARKQSAELQATKTQLTRRSLSKSDTGKGAAA